MTIEDTHLDQQTAGTSMLDQFFWILVGRLFRESRKSETRRSRSRRRRSPEAGSIPAILWAHSRAIRSSCARRDADPMTGETGGKSVRLVSVSAGAVQGTGVTIEGRTEGTTDVMIGGTDETTEGALQQAHSGRGESIAMG